jgi:anti-sigma regulatory factor (Ser/Thr protein kinase)
VSPSPNGSDLRAQTMWSLNDPSQIGEARRAAIALAARLNFDPTQAGKVAIVVNEAASNVIKHTRGGELLLSELHGKTAAGIEMLWLDRGPAMADPERCLHDGFSTAGTPGTGLGAIRRLSNLFDLHSMPEAGTAILSRVNAIPGDTGRGELEIGAVHVPKRGEPVSGDAWALEVSTERTLVFVVDGLGHGTPAADAARDAVRVFRAHQHLEPTEIMKRIHAALRSTRGAAAALAAIGRSTRMMRYVGVGNISGVILADDGTSRSSVSHNGTLGHEARKIDEFVYPFPEGALLLMHSDGVATSWKLDAYAGLARRHAGLIAGVLYRDFQRGRDDATVVAVRAPVKEEA